MRKPNSSFYATFATLFVFAAFTVIPFSASAQLQQEQREVIYAAPAGEPRLIPAGISFEQQVTFRTEAYPVRRMLRVVGGIKMPEPFAARGETHFREAEFLIDDNLDPVNVHKDRYSLYFKGENDPFERHAYNRITDLRPEEGPVTLEFQIRQEELKVAPGGDFGVELQIYYRRDDRHPHDVYDRADSILYIPIPEGRNARDGFYAIQKTFRLPEQAVAILLRVGGTNFSGEAWIEAPRLWQNGTFLFEAPFVRHADRTNDYNYWVGVNLSTRSWPLWRLEFGGETIFEGHIFDRASDIADFYIPLPEGIRGSGPLRLTLLEEEHRAAFGYELHRAELISESARPFEIAYVPKYVTWGDTTGLLIEINRPGITLDIKSGPEVRLLKPERMHFERTGLHVIPFRAMMRDQNIPIGITHEGETRTAVIEQFILKDPDRVYLSSGDEVHLDKEPWLYDYFFKWYFRERVGNWYQFRPSYQWSGVRITSEAFARHYASLLNEMHVPYAWQMEGRTLAATRINASTESLQTPMFRGKQAHENDGGYYYWRHFQYYGLHCDMAARTRPYGGIFAKHRPIYTDYGVFIHYDPYAVKDMADGANRLVANLAYSRGPSTRHTGPSTMFRYLYQAGYDWLGAEQMYGPENTIMSALRGASLAYGKTDFGSLHAVQWGSFPFTDPQHAHRFYMSLAVAYMQGASHINTEEGLWTDEYANDRYSEAGRQHMYAQHRMLDYIETHMRTGELYAPIAVIQGRNDAWKAFVRGPVWSQEGDVDTPAPGSGSGLRKEGQWDFNSALESFDLLEVFYPGNTLDNCGPEGWFTEAPYGAVDLLPVEAPQSVMNRYKAILFLGWNTFDNADFVRLKKFVEQGGTLLLGAVHLNSELRPDRPVRFPEDDTLIRLLLGNDYKSYETVQRISLGKGEVIYFPQSLYPADSEIREAYTAEIRRMAEESVKEETERGWIRTGEHIDFTCWEAGDIWSTRTLYLLNTDWQSEPAERTATLLLRGQEYALRVPRYTIVTVRCVDGTAALMEGNTSDVLNIDEKQDRWIVTCQTTGPDTLRFFRGDRQQQEVRTLSEAGVHRIEFGK